ncbi:MAG: SDR family NAD(P)-dependent oxidoreductase, partial [Myxococcota bacterium]
MKHSVALLEGRVALVTGSSHGIGAAIARALSAHGAAVCVNYFQSKDEGEAVADSINSNGGRALAVQADVRSGQQVKAMVDAAVEKLGGLDIVVNNALHDYRFDPAANPRFEAMSWPQFQAQIDGTVAGAVHTLQAALPALRARGGGSVINILTNLISNPVVQYHA